MKNHDKRKQTQNAKNEYYPEDRWAEHEVINRDRVFDYSKYLDVSSGRLTVKEKDEMRKEIKKCINWCKENNQPYAQYIEMKKHFGL